jgi:hypothetical protein
MKSLPRSVGGALALLALVASVVIYDARPGLSSDHQDSPKTVARPGADITDVFVYPDPNDATRVVLQMDVDPLLAPGAATTSAALDPDVLYQFKISHGATAGAEDMVVQFKATSAGPTQQIAVYGPTAPSQTGVNSTLVGTPTLVGYNASTTLASTAKVFVGPRTEPFFFDLAQFFKIIPDRNYMNQPNPPAATATGFRGFAAGNANGCDTSTASNILAGYNVLSIVFEAPKALIAPAGGSQMIHVYATTSTTSGT